MNLTKFLTQSSFNLKDLLTLLDNYPHEKKTTDTSETFTFPENTDDEVLPATISIRDNLITHVNPVTVDGHTVNGYCANIEITIEYGWFKKPAIELHREDGPARMVFRGSSKNFNLYKTSENWAQYDYFFNPNGPYQTSWCYSKTLNKYIIEDETYDIVGGQKVIRYHNDTGKVYSISYISDGKYHRIDGPAYIKYDNDGNITHTEYSVDGGKTNYNGPCYVNKISGEQKHELPTSEWLEKIKKTKTKKDFYKLVLKTL